VEHQLRFALRTDEGSERQPFTSPPLSIPIT
jgi:hypothetical protein